LVLLHVRRAWNIVEPILPRHNTQSYSRCIRKIHTLLHNRSYSNVIHIQNLQGIHYLNITSANRPKDVLGIIGSKRMWYIRESSISITIYMCARSSLRLHVLLLVAESISVWIHLDDIIESAFFFK
jgi:hypothetical protein